MFRNLGFKLIVIGIINAGLLMTAVAEDGSGTLSIVKGNVQVQSGKDKTVVPARVGMKVFQGDTIITAADSRAKLNMVDKNIIPYLLLFALVEYYDSSEI